jgi:hypothetical protein
MHDALMSCKTNLSNECFVTCFTAIRALTSMYVCMLYQTTLVTECLITHIKNIWALTSMYALMSLDLSVDRMPYYTHHKYKGHHHCVCVDVLSDQSVDWMLITHVTIIRALTTMYACMLYQATLVTETLITHITNIRALTTMYSCMPYQTTLVTECLITHITNMRALTSVYALMSFQIGL